VPAIVERRSGGATDLAACGCDDTTA